MRESTGHVERGPAGDNPHRIRLPAWVQRYATLFIVVALAVTLVGFLRGTHEPMPLARVEPAVVEKSAEVPAAVAYSELPHATIRANAEWKSELEKLQSAPPSPFEPVVRTEEMKLAALQDRNKNRAFDAAPPVVPHGIDQMTTSSCLACHQNGLRVGERVATKVSHPHYANCTQCHVESQRSEAALVGESMAENTFHGTPRAGAGTRAWPGAPPTIPHTTWMRQDCTSCHGVVARAGLRTTHPWLMNCTQCHAPSAKLDQVQFSKDQP